MSRSSKTPERKMIRQRLDCLKPRTWIAEAIESASPAPRRSLRPTLIRVPVHLPAEIARRGFVHRRRDARKIRGHVMLEAVLADVVQQLLHARNLHHARAAERFQRIVGESPPPT